MANTTHIKSFTVQEQEYLKDESRLLGYADSISFPESHQEIIAIVAELAKTTECMTLQGARTGLTGGAVPNHGHIMNFAHYNNILGMRFNSVSQHFYLRVQPGVVLEDLNQAIHKKQFDVRHWSQESKSCLQRFKRGGNYFFPPDPTEKSATIGGMVACNASGARTFKYGSTRNYITALRLVLSDGDELEMKRGVQKATGQSFKLITKRGRSIEGNLPNYIMPAVKNAAGFFVLPDMDLIDLFIGSEGTLGIISEVEIELIPLPEHIYGLTTFFAHEAAALDFVNALRAGAYQPAAIEFFNHHALSLMRQERCTNPAFSTLQPIHQHYHSAVYVEWHAFTIDNMQQVLCSTKDIMEKCGGNATDTWLAINNQMMEQLHFFRHGIPEIVNKTIDQRRRYYPNLTKLGTDMAVPDQRLNDVMQMYRDDLSHAQLESVIFGHIGNNHLHVNIIPRNMEEYASGKALYLQWAQRVVEMGGTVSAEHGIGKFKTPFLTVMFGEVHIEQMQKLKAKFDTEWRLNSGNLFEKQVT